MLGRVLPKGDDHTAVLSYQYWVRSLGRDPHVVGQTLRVKRHPFQIVGVVSEQFVGTTVDSGPDVWIPLSNGRDFWTHRPKASLDGSVIEIIARLRPGVSLVQAAQEATLADDAARDHGSGQTPRVNGSVVARLINLGLSAMRSES